LKIEPAGGSVVDNYTSLRPDGFSDTLAEGNANGVMRNIYASYDSSTLTADTAPIWDWRFPSNGTLYTNLTVENITLNDVNPTPTTMPVTGLVSAGSYGLSIKGMKIYMLDCPSGTASQTLNFAGNTFNIQADIYYAQCDSTQTGRGALSLSAGATNSNYDITVHGWRKYPLILTGALLINATSFTLLNNFGLTSGSYQVYFPSGEVRTATLTNGSPGPYTITALSSAEAATGGSILGSLNTNFDQWKQRIALGTGMGNHAHLLDVTNGYESTIENGLQTEYYTQLWFGAPTSGASTFTTPILFPSPMAIDEIGYRVNTTPTTTTSADVGCGSNATALLAAQSVTATTFFAPYPTFAPTTACGSNAIFLTSHGGNFDGSGQFQISVRGSQIRGAN